MRIGLQTWGSEGDVQPFIALAAGLAAAGHEVTLVTTDSSNKDFTGVAQRFGFCVKHVRASVQPAPELFLKSWREIIHEGNPLRQAESLLTLGFDNVTDLMFEAAEALCADSDVVIGHFMAFPLRVAAEKVKVPVGTLHFVYNSLPSNTIRPLGFPELGRWSYPIGWKITGMLLNKVFLPRVNALRIREGLAPATDLLKQIWTSERLNLVAVSPSFFQAPPAWPENYHVSGFLNLPVENMMTDSISSDLETFITAGDPPVYFTFGSMLIPNLEYIRETVQIWVNTVYKLGCRAIFQLPWDDLSAFDTDHKCIFKVKRTPHKDVFPRCALIVHHGGAGTTQASLLAGRASVVVAHLGDQFFWGDELERLGVAGPTQKRKNLTAVRLSRSVQSVFNTPAMSQRALAIGTAMKKEEGASAAVRLIENKLCATVAVNT